MGEMAFACDDPDTRSELDKLLVVIAFRELANVFELLWRETLENIPDVSPLP